MTAMSWHRRVGLMALASMMAVSLVGAQPATLNPLVPRAREVQGSVPADCAAGLAPAVEPRVAIREIPLPEVEPAAAAAEAPPSASLRDALQDAQAALARNDRPAFDEARARARSLMTTYPSGGERRTAEELVRTYDTAARLWDAQFESPFFDEASPEFALMNAYSGWEPAVRRSAITDPGTGRRFYPASESRDFLARHAADRLRGLGVEAPVRVTRTEPAPRTPAVTQPRRTTPSVTRANPSPSATTARPRTSTRRSNRGTPTTRSASAAPGTTPRGTRPRLSTAPAHPRLNTEPRTAAPVTTAPGTPDPQASPTTAAAPEPAAPAAGSPGPASAPPDGAATPAPDAPTDVPDAPDVTTTPAISGTDTAVTAAPAPASSVPAPVAPSRSRSIVLPAILILIGLGVLIVLFRASK